MKYIVNIILLLVITSTFGQTKIQLKLDHGKGFFSVYPPPETPKGILILLPDYLEDEETFLHTTSVMNQAYVQGIITVVVSVGRKIFADGDVVELLSEVCKKSVEAFEVPRDKVVFGGYGYGGTILLKYAQLCLKYENDFPIKPAAIYTVNTHVDIALAFKSYERQIERNLNLESTQSAKNYRDIMLRILQGTPDEDPFIYDSYSPFKYGSKSVNNIEMFVNTPVRLYHDTDLIWNMQNNHISAFDMQSTASSEFIYQLKKLGNDHAEFLATDIENSTSKRVANKRTLIDEKNLNLWIVRQLGIE
ncbi:MAG: hypothetical protein ACJA08_002823 [Cyclobacteriaceae bacterium]|jgi:hypothetical protein